MQIISKKKKKTFSSQDESLQSKAFDFLMIKTGTMTR